MNCQFLYDEQFLPSLPIEVKHMIDDDGECDCNDDGDDFCYGNVDVDYKEQDPNNLSFFGENMLFSTQMRQSGTLEKDLLVKSRWMSGGVLCSLDCGL